MLSTPAPIDTARKASRLFKTTPPPPLSTKETDIIHRIKSPSLYPPFKFKNYMNFLSALNLMHS